MGYYKKEPKDLTLEEASTLINGDIEPVAANCEILTLKHAYGI